MQRSVRVGRGRLNVLQAPLHDAAAARRLVEALDLLAPERVHIDADHDTWERIARRPGALGRFERVRLDVASRFGPVEPNALWHAVGDWVADRSVPVSVNPGRDAPLGRRQAARLRRRVKRQGLEAVDAADALARLHDWVVPDSPDVQAWLEARWSRLATLLREQYTPGGRGVLVAGYPDGDAVADRIQSPRGARNPQ